jgi:signal transduction histidine kinase
MTSKSRSEGAWLEQSDQVRLLLDISQALTSTLDLEHLYQVTLDRLHDLIPFIGAVIGIVTSSGWVQAAARRPSGIGEGVIERRSGWAESEWVRRLSGGVAFYLGDIRGDDPLAVEYRAYLTVPIEQSAMRYFRSIMEVPLILNDEVVGEISVSHQDPGFFNDAHLQLVTAVGRYLVIAIENARLYSDAQEHARELASLLSVSRSVSTSLDTTSLARVVLGQLREVMDYGNASLVMREGALMRIVYANTHDNPDPREEVIGATFDLANAGPIWETLERGEPLVVADNRDGGYWSQAYQRVVGELYDTAFAGVRSWLGVPLRVRGQTIGFITISSPKPAQFKQRHVDLAMAYAAQVSVAFENADLVRQAQSVAAIEERQRLARELHDSVSQALYGIALGARTARTQLDRDPAAAREPVDYVLSLAEAGLAEMRALIFELRPESLEKEGLVAALEKQVAATRARYGFTVTAALGDEPDLSPAAREAFYRVAQEALHNIVKHARPTEVDVRLASDGGGVELRVRDNGVGFDPAGEFAGHLGLESMRERAARVGAVLSIDSSPGGGTTVALRVPS